MTLHTFTGIFETGGRATVRAENTAEARRHLAMTGRGERFRLAQGGTFGVWGRDEDDDY